MCGITPETLKIHVQAEKRGHKTVNISLAVSFWSVKNYDIKSREHCFRYNKENKEVVKQDKVNSVARGR